MVSEFFPDESLASETLSSARLVWQPLKTGPVSPGRRSRHVQVFDPTREATLLFGGIDWGAGTMATGTWELRHGDWRRLTLPTEPSSRQRAAMAFDPDRGYAVLFGGQTGSGTFSDETWLYADGQWRRYRSWFGPSPPPRDGHVLVHDPVLRGVLLFGGHHPHRGAMSDVWLFDHLGWRQLRSDFVRHQAGGPPQIPVRPPARTCAAAAYHPRLGGMLVHGGSSGPPTGSRYRDAWLFREGVWQPMPHLATDDTRDDHAMAWHPSIRRMVLMTDINAHPATEIDGPGGWTGVPMEAHPPSLQEAPLTWDRTLEGLVLHGGEAAPGGAQFDQTWRLCWQLGDDAPAISRPPLSLSTDGPLPPSPFWTKAQA